MKIETFNDNHYWIPDHLLKAFHKAKSLPLENFNKQFNDFLTDENKIKIPKYFEQNHNDQIDEIEIPKHLIDDKNDQIDSS